MSQNHSLTNQTNLDKAIEPLLNLPQSFSNQRMLLHEMFTTSCCNASDDEIDNFTAKKLTPFYLAMLETLENLEKLNLK